MYRSYFFLFFFSLGIISYVVVTIAKHFACIIVLNLCYKSTTYEVSDLHFRNLEILEMRPQRSICK